MEYSLEAMIIIEKKTEQQKSASTLLSVIRPLHECYILVESLPVFT
jgi:hypothetical protein